MGQVLFWEQVIAWCFVEHYFRCSWAAVLLQWASMQRIMLLIWNGLSKINTARPSTLQA
jgi:hypothetical protein